MSEALNARRAGRTVLDAVREDPDLVPAEKETTLALTKPDGVFTGYTAEAGVARRLLAHPHVPVRGVTVPDGDARRDVSLEGYDGQTILGVRFAMPVGVLSVRGSPRSSTGHADMVTQRVLDKVSQS